MTRKEYMKKWQQDNKEKTRENAKRYYYKNIDKIKEKRQSNEYKEKYREYKRNWARENRKTQKEVISKLQSNWNSLKKENKALRLLLNWAEECDWGFDNFRDDDVIDWEEFEEESEDMDYIESMIFYAKKYLEMNELEGENNGHKSKDV